jgi:hypothetical protein
LPCDATRAADHNDTSIACQISSYVSTKKKTIHKKSARERTFRFKPYRLHAEKIKREILSKHGSFALANLEVIITRISTTKTDGTLGFCNKCFIMNKKLLARENAA